MKGIISLTFVFLLVSCARDGKVESGVSSFEGVIGKKIDILIKNHGSPEQIDPSNMYSRKFAGSTGAVVLVYPKDGKLVYVAKDCVVIGVFPIGSSWTANSNESEKVDLSDGDKTSN